MEKTRDPAREKHERLVARCQESPAVQKALGNVVDACEEFIFVMVTDGNGACGSGGNG